MSTSHSSLERPVLPLGVSSALFAALLFGVSTPLAKLLLGDVSPVLLAALFYLGSGIGLTLLYIIHRRHSTAEAPIARKDIRWLGGALFFGGVLGPVLLMVGLSTTTASSASLLLNMESVFTVVLAWFIFRENFDRRIAFGMVFILAGGIILSIHGTNGILLSGGSIAVVAACLCWGIDNNLTQKVSASDPVQIAAIKGIVAGSVDLAIAVILGAKVPPLTAVAASMLAGFFCYGISLVLFVSALRRVGTARTSAYFSLAPFIGATLSVFLLHESPRVSLLIAALFMGTGVWLHLTERHSHEHTHEALKHNHRHVHDEHHQHEHAADIDAHEPHSHEHTHEPITHAHPHYPDIHHRHPH